MTPPLAPAPSDLELLQAQLRRLGPAASFSWHKQQEFVLRASTDTVMVVGGNGSGKSKVGEGVISRLTRREGPVYERLRHREGRPLVIWVAPETDEKAKSLWEPRLLDMLQGLDGVTYLQSPHKVMRWQDAHGGGEIWLKSQEQGFKSFESNDVDLILFDEEPIDRRLVTSAKTRFRITNGVLVLTFTPLHGMSWTYDELYAPVAELPGLRYLVADRVWRKGNEITVVQMGMADNPEAVLGGGVERLLNDPSITPAEKDARLYGRYGYTEGLLIPQFAGLKADSPSLYVLDRLPKDRPFLWILTADPNKRHGALLTALDPFGNRYYCAEHYAEGIPDSVHAEGYRRMIAEFRHMGCNEHEIEAYADPGGAGSQAIINLAETGFFALPVPKDRGSVSASIKRLRRAAHIDHSHAHPLTGEFGAPYVYFLRSLESTWTSSGGQRWQESRLMWEFRQYRQKVSKAGDEAEPDTPIKKNDDLVDCARYVELAHPEPPQMAEFDQAELERKELRRRDQLSAEEADQYDVLLKRIESQPRGNIYLN